MRVTWFIIWSLVLSGFVCLDKKPSNDNSYIPLAEKIAHDRIPLDSISIYISKTDYYLQVRYDTIIIATYPAVFGGNPIKDKLMQGDRCTPEGIFRVRELYPHKKWSKFIWIDYPTADSWEKHNAAKNSGLIPEYAQIGGEIGIHGVEDGYDYAIDQKMNWTLGCISLKNKDVNELYSVIRKGTLVEIE